MVLVNETMSASTGRRGIHYTEIYKGSDSQIFQTMYHPRGHVPIHARPSYCPHRFRHEQLVFALVRVFTRIDCHEMEKKCHFFTDIVQHARYIKSGSALGRTNSKEHYNTDQCENLLVKEGQNRVYKLECERRNLHKRRHRNMT